MVTTRYGKTTISTHSAVSELLATVVDLSYSVTWHSLVNYHDKHYVTVYTT